MKPLIQISRLATLTVLLAICAPSLNAQTPDPDPERFTDDFARFATWDAENFIPENGIVFLGSSSINYWRTAEAFPGLPVINRGFGGSQAADAAHWVQEVALKYDPALIVYYEGDNDTARGMKADEIFEDMHEFVHAVHHSGSDAEILFMSVKPSPARMEVWAEAQRTNALIKSFADSHEGVYYVDVGSDLLGSDGQPIPEYYVPDGIHMTPAGYVVWDRVVGKALGEILSR